MWDSPATDVADLPPQDAPFELGPPGETAAPATHERLAWLVRAMSAADFMPVETGRRDAARRAVQELNNLAGEALAGWTETGGTCFIRLTPRGRRLSVALLTMRAEHERLLARFGQAFGEDIRLLDRVAVRTSARNQFVARVASRPTGTLREEILLELPGRRFITVAITRESVAALALKPGLEVVALVKASAIDLRLGGGKLPGHRNRLTGTIAHVVRDPDMAEVVVDLGAGLTGTALVARFCAARTRIGARATLSFQPDAVIIGRVA